MYIYCIHLFMSLFIIASQSVFGKSFAKPLAKVFRKTSNYRGMSGERRESATQRDTLMVFT